MTKKNNVKKYSLIAENIARDENFEKQLKKLHELKKKGGKNNGNFSSGFYLRKVQ